MKKLGCICIRYWCGRRLVPDRQRRSGGESEGTPDGWHRAIGGFVGFLVISLGLWLDLTKTSRRLQQARRPRLWR